VLAKAADVITYVEHGVCDVGVVGRDTIMEEGGSFYELLDLGFGKCRFALAGIKGKNFYEGHSHKVIATKYPNVSKKYFADKDVECEIIKIDGVDTLVFTITKADASTIEVKQTGEVNTPAKFAEALVAAINGLDGTAGVEGKVYHTNTNLGAQTFSNVDISWVWDFDAAGAGTNDAKDTMLGDLAAAGTKSTIELSYGAKVTQID